VLRPEPAYLLRGILVLIRLLAVAQRAIPASDLGVGLGDIIE